MPTETFLLLSLTSAASPPDDPQQHASAPHAAARMLNTAGRWAVHGSAKAPLLAWPSSEAAQAQAAAERASASRGRSIEAVSRANSGWTEGREIQHFTDAFEPVLHAPVPQSEARARRLRTEADKLEAFSLIVRRASAAADQKAFAEIGRAAAKALRVRFGGGSITSAFAWLAGSAGAEALESVLTGEVELSGALTLGDTEQAVNLAREAERLREQG